MGILLRTLPELLFGHALGKGDKNWISRCLVLGILGPGQLGPGQLGPGQLGPGQLGPGAQLSALKNWTVGPNCPLFQGGQLGPDSWALGQKPSN